MSAALRRKPAFVNRALLLLLLFFGCFVLYPLVCMFSQLLQTDIGAIIHSRSFREAVSATLLSAFLVTLCSTVLALAMALLLCRTAVPGKAIWRTLFILPMLLPSVSNGTGLVLLLGNNGFLTRLLHLSGSIYGLQGIVLGQLLYTAPAAFLLLYQAFAEEDYRPHEAAAVLGFSRLRRFCVLTLPYLRRDLIAAAFLVFSMSVTDYGIPLAIGGRVETLAVVMYAKVAGRLQFDKGSFIGLCLLLPAVLSFLADSRRRGRAVSQRTAFPLAASRQAKAISGTACALIALLFVLPVLAFVAIMLMEEYPLHTSLTLRHLAEYWTARGRMGLRNSLLMSAGAALLGTVAACFAAYIAARQQGLFSRLLHILALLVLSVPGLVLGLSYALAFKRLPIYGSLWLLIVSSSIHFFTTPYLMLYQRFGKLDRDLEGTGAVLGVRPFRLFWDVMLPQCKDTLLDMLSFFFVNSMVTISAVVFLANAATRPLSLLVTQYHDQMNLAGAATLSFLILAVNFLVRTLLLCLKGKKTPEKYKAFGAM